MRKAWTKQMLLEIIERKFREYAETEGRQLTEILAFWYLAGYAPDAEIGIVSEAIEEAKRDHYLKTSF